MLGSAQERFEDKCMPVPWSGCTIWTGGTAGKGYGEFWNGNRVVYAHRFAYEQVFGPIPKGLTIDHLCRVISCVNPHHLEAVTMKENLFRGNGIGSINSRKTHCINGHALSGDNLSITNKGHRDCRSCKRNRKLKYLGRIAANA